MRVKVGDETRIVELQDGIELLESGDAIFAIDQVDPPFEIIGVLKERLRNLDVLGAPLNQPNLQEAIGKALVPHGIRQRAVQGYPVPWKSLDNNFRENISRKLLFRGPGFLDYTELCETAWHYHFRSPRCNDLEIFSQNCSIDYELEHGLAYAADFSGRDRLAYKVVGKDWRSFRFELDKLSHQVSVAIKKAQDDGRIILTENSPGGERLVPPSQASRRLPSRDLKPFYLLSSELPEIVLSSYQRNSREKLRARSWLERVEEQVCRGELKARYEDRIAVMMTKFNLTKSAAKSVYSDWRSGDEPVRRGKASDYMTMNQLYEIE